MSVWLYVYMPKQSARKNQPPPKEQRHRTTLNIPVELWKKTKMRAIELGIDAQDLVVAALASYLREGDVKGGKR